MLASSAHQARLMSKSLFCILFTLPFLFVEHVTGQATGSSYAFETIESKPQHQPVEVNLSESSLSVPQPARTNNQETSPATEATPAKRGHAKLGSNNPEKPVAKLPKDKNKPKKNFEKKVNTAHQGVFFNNDF